MWSKIKKDNSAQYKVPGFWVTNQFVFHLQKYDTVISSLKVFSYIRLIKPQEPSLGTAAFQNFLADVLHLFFKFTDSLKLQYLELSFYYRIK